MNKIKTDFNHAKWRKSIVSHRVSSTFYFFFCVSICLGNISQLISKRKSTFGKSIYSFATNSTLKSSPQIRIDYGRVCVCFFSFVKLYLICIGWIERNQRLSYEINDLCLRFFLSDSLSLCVSLSCVCIIITLMLNRKKKIRIKILRTTLKCVDKKLWISL